MENKQKKQDNSKRKRNHQIIIRCSDEELIELNQAVEKSGLTRVDFLISVLHNGRITVVEDLQEICIELKKQGINLNQSLRFAYQHGDNAHLMKTIGQCNGVYTKAKDLLFATEIKVRTK